MDFLSNTILGLLLLLLVLAIIIIVMIYRVYKSSAFNIRIDNFDRQLEKNERLIRDELTRSREENSLAARHWREEVSLTINAMSDALLKRMTDIAGLQKNQLEVFSGQLKILTESNEGKLDKLREAVENRLQLIQEDNAKKLEQMRATVDEKLHDTLEKRLGESFKLVSERLELVQRGLGEMQTLASGVGDLKKVLTNVKTRGGFGEVQLATLLEQILAPSQYSCSVEIKKGSGQRVDFALCLPGRDATSDSVVWLPLDAKFPQEDYLKLIEAQEKADPVAAEDAARKLERAVKEMAKSIHDKYLDPPQTTDFAIMFLPTEGLYAEVLRRPAFSEMLQREFKILAAGPTTLAALLNSLQMGFRTLAIEKRSAEVWTLLGAVRTEFSKFGTVLEKTSKKLQEAGNHIDQAAIRTRAIERKLKSVQELPEAEAGGLLELPELKEEEDN